MSRRWTHDVAKTHAGDAVRARDYAKAWQIAKDYNFDDVDVGEVGLDKHPSHKPKDFEPSYRSTPGHTMRDN